MSNYPAGTHAADPNAPWNQPDADEDDPKWFTFHGAIVGIKATSKEAAMEKITAMFDALDVECDYAPERVEEG